jgi:hypothetical protein
VPAVQGNRGVIGVPDAAPDENARVAPHHPPAPAPRLGFAFPEAAVLRRREAVRTARADVSVRGERPSIENANHRLETKKLPTAERFSSTLCSAAGEAALQPPRLEVARRSIQPPPEAEAPARPLAAGSGPPAAGSARCRPGGLFRGHHLTGRPPPASSRPARPSVRVFG